VIFVRFVIGDRDSSIAALSPGRIARGVRITLDPKFLLDRDSDIFVDRAGMCLFLFDAKLGQ
jgi:hypothetical protein